MYAVKYGENILFPDSKAFASATKDFLTGLSIMTTQTISKRTVIAKIHGEITGIISPNSVQIAPNKHLHDPYILGLLTHSCEPNVAFNSKKMELSSTRRIEPNEFLTIDFTETEDYLFRQFECRCKSKKCKGWILGKKEVRVKRTEKNDA